MEQLVQQLKDGTMQLLEVPFPVLGPGMVMVRNHYSAISAGTEGKTVNDARLGYLAKARARQNEVKKVVKAARTYGLADTYKMVMNKLEAPSALGYSCAGEVIAIADDVRGFRVGDRVACAGGSAVHAEVVAVPENLCAKVPESVSLDEASMTTIAAIALQGIRLSDTQLGGNAVVIGLGLIGKMTMILLRAAGVRPIGVDIDARQVESTRALGFDHVFVREQHGIENEIIDLCEGFGTDAVLITAGTSSLDPVNLAGRVARPKGKVVIVGNVPTGFDRKDFYRKELDLRMSASYGPGRYDRAYEEEGLDYPIGYVRWTENRNMQAVLAMLASGAVDFSPLISHRFDFRDARQAYDMIVSKSEEFAGVILAYDTGKTLAQKVVRKQNTPMKSGVVVASFIGAGSFAQNFLLPNLAGLHLRHIVTARPNNARNVADKYGFAGALSSVEELLADEHCNTVFVATRHDTHAQYVLAALRAGKNVFVEKPLCLHPDELEEIARVAAQSAGRLMVGFNRRFSPVTDGLKKELKPSRPVSMHYQINAGALPADHWVHDPKTGGGRILGEACHFIDLAIFLSGSKVQSIQVTSLGTSPGVEDTAAIVLKMVNGSVAVINYFSNGHPSLPKERLEVQQDGQFWQVEDFKKLRKNGLGKPLKTWAKAQKGYGEELQAFADSIRKGEPAPISLEELYHSMWVTFKVLEELKG
ncbi:MAG: oxidoreductase [Cryomorphaceae bacterium]|nr:MAG: oxidoreductase [Cryomorphaceae bacterium]